MSKIFGGSKSSSQQTSISNNKAYGTVSNAFSPLLQNAASGINAYNAMLSGDTSGFDKFKDATGYNFAMDRGVGNITGSAAGTGMVRSGAAAKALQSFGSGLQNQYANTYLDKLLNQANLGFQAGDAITNAGNYSYGQGTSQSKSSEGIAKFVGQIASAAAMASDIRLKKNIHKIGEYKGLNLYQYRYINNSGPFIGVMAQEVAEKRPDALGSEIGGYMTVNYGALTKEAA